jgi:hypothetical protein
MSKAWSKDLHLKPNTLGKTKSCQTLVGMMNENIISSRDKHKVLSFINEMVERYRVLSLIKNSKVKAYTFEVIRKNVSNLIELMPYDEKFVSYLKNVNVYYFRKYLKGCCI